MPEKNFNFTSSNQTPPSLIISSVLFFFLSIKEKLFDFACCKVPSRVRPSELHLRAWLASIYNKINKKEFIIKVRERKKRKKKQLRQCCSRVCVKKCKLFKTIFHNIFTREIVWRRRKEKNAAARSGWMKQQI